MIFDIPVVVQMTAGGSHASGDAELGKTPLSAWARGVNLPRLSAGLCTRFRVLSFKRKTANFSETKRGARTRHVVFTWRILIFVFCFGLLAVPLLRHES